MLSALQMGYAGVCGCDLPENQEVQCTVLTNAKARLGISPGDLCEWMGSDVMNLILPEHLSRRLQFNYCSVFLLEWPRRSSSTSNAGSLSEVGQRQIGGCLSC
jgi:hypothetical protein